MKLDLKKFCRLLSQAGRQAGPNVEVNPYLLDHVLMPVLNGSDVLIRDIDFSRFEEEDIENLAEYYDCLRWIQKETARLEERLGQIPPAAGKVRAFC